MRSGPSANSDGKQLIDLLKCIMQLNLTHLIVIAIYVGKDAIQYLCVNFVNVLNMCQSQ